VQNLVANLESSVATDFSTLSSNIANTYATQTSLSTAISNEQQARTTATTLLTTQLGSNVRGLNLNAHFDFGYDHYSENPTSFDSPSETSKFKLESNDSTPDVVTGGEALRIVGPATLFYRYHLPVDTTRTYKVRIRVKSIGTTNARMYAGVSTFDRSGSLQTSSPGTHRYGAASNVYLPSDNTWRVYEGLFTGTGSSTHNQFRSGTAYAVPMMILNYQGNNSYITLVDELTLEDVTEAEDNKATILTVQDAVSNLSSSTASSLSTLQTSFANTYATKTELATVASNANAASVSVLSTMRTEVSTMNTSVRSAAATAADNAQSAATAAGAAAAAAAAGAVNTALRGVISSEISTLSTLISNVNTSLASDFSSLSTSFDGMNTSVSTLSSSVDGIKGSYGISVDNNGHISGFSLVSTLAEDSSNATSEFTVAADKFNIINPNDTTDQIAPFAVITTGTDAGVYVNGAVIKPGSITAASINAINLSAINANLGTIEAGTLSNASGTFFIDLNNGTITISV
jgi:hypothetical protein